MVYYGIKGNFSATSLPNVTHEAEHNQLAMHDPPPPHAQSSCLCCLPKLQKWEGRAKNLADHNMRPNSCIHPDIGHSLCWCGLRKTNLETSKIKAHTSMIFMRKQLLFDKKSMANFYFYFAYQRNIGKQKRYASEVTDAWGKINSNRINYLSSLPSHGEKE